MKNKIKGGSIQSLGLGLAEKAFKTGLKGLNSSPQVQLATTAMSLGQDVGKHMGMNTNMFKKKGLELFKSHGASIAQVAGTSAPPAPSAQTPQTAPSAQTPQTAPAALVQLTPNDANILKKSFIELTNALKPIGVALGIPVASEASLAGSGSVSSGSVSSGSVASERPGANILGTISGLTQRPELQALAQQGINAISKLNVKATNIPAIAPAEATGPAQAPAESAPELSIVKGGFKRLKNKSRKIKNKSNKLKTRRIKSKRSSNKKR